jgi:translation initiation factor IF-3
LKKLRRNQRIEALAVRVIGKDAEQLGVMPRERAIESAVALGLDLVEVSPKAQPPVCKIMDYGKYLYKIKKQDQLQKKMTKQTEVKGVRLGLNTGIHDLEVKAKRARKFLADKCLIKVSLIFKGREMAHRHMGKDKMLEFAEMLSDVAEPDLSPKMQGYQLNMMLTPKKQ